MKTEETRTRPGGPRNEQGRSTGRILVGLILLAIGLGWLLEAANLIDFPSRIVLPVALILVGVALLAQARRRHTGGLIAIGIILTVVLTLIPDTRVGFEGGVGERVETPLSASELRQDYRLGLGSFTLDLSEVDLPRGTTNVEARVGMGELTVFVQEGIDVEVEARTGAGEIIVLGRRVASGLGANVDSFRVESTDESAANGGVTGADASDSQFAQSRELRLDLRVGLGPIRVSHVPS